MRIGFDAKRLFNNFTGLGNYSRFVVKALLDNYANHHYTLYSPKIKQHLETQQFRVNPKLLIRTPPTWVRGSGFGSFWRSVNLGNIAFRDGMDIYHGLSNELPVTKPKGLKTVVTIHDLIFIRYPELYHKIDTKIYRKKLKHACESADKIITISKQTANDLKQYFEVSEERIQVIYQGCDEIFKQKFSNQEVQSVLKKYNLPENFVLTVGTIEARKNALVLLKAAVQLSKDVSIVLIGKPTKYQAQLNQFIAENNLNSRVRFVHDVVFTDLPKIYQASKVFVYPSRFEGFGIPIVEAIHSQVPVIAATGSCLEEAGGPSSMYIDPDDADALAEGIKVFLRDEARRTKVVANGLDFVKQFEPPQIAANMMDVYQSVLS